MLQPNQVYHIYNQGINRQPIFLKREDYLNFLSRYILIFQDIASTIAWNLMPDHFHFMVHTDNRSIVEIKQGSLTIDVLSNGVRKLLSSYAQSFNNRNKRTGSLFRQKTKIKCLTDPDTLHSHFESVEDSLKNCFNYIHANPVLAGLVETEEEWEFSSFRDYAAVRKPTFCSFDLAEKFCNYNSGNFNYHV